MKQKKFIPFIERLSPEQAVEFLKKKMALKRRIARRLSACEPLKQWIVIAHRWGYRDAHSYLVGAYSTAKKANEIARGHVAYRGGKYGVEVVVCNVDSGKEDGNAGKQSYYVECPYFGSARQNRPSVMFADWKKQTTMFKPKNSS
jgi:hypothetical protein